MRFSIGWFCVAIASLCIVSSATFGQDNSQLARISARRELDAAKLELRYYWQVEYPRQRRHLNAQIELVEAEIKALRNRLRAYQPFDRFSIGRPFSLTIQDVKMCLLDAELRLRDLWAERNALMRFHPTQWQLLERNVYEARLRVAELEADDPVATEPLAQQP